MPESDELKNSVKEPVKNIAREVVSDIVYRITRAGTKRAIRELKRELKDSAFRRIQEKIGDLSERQIEELFKKTADKLTRQVTESGAERRQLVREIEQAFRQGLKKTLSNLVKFPVLPVAIAAAVVLGGLIIWIASIDRTPPTVSVTASAEPGQEVTFRVLASDNRRVDWIELTVNGEVVREGDMSPLVFTGGPYEEGAKIVYSAIAWDAAGNERFTGERAIPIAQSPPTPEPTAPDLVISGVNHEWVGTDVANIFFVIENRGKAEAGASMAVLRRGENVIGRQVVNALGPGEIRVLVFPAVKLDSNGFTVTVCADWGKEVSESDEENNCSEPYIHVG